MGDLTESRIDAIFRADAAEKAAYYTAIANEPEHTMTTTNAYEGDYGEHYSYANDCYDEIPYAGPGADFYCDYCEKTGHPFSSCPARDDEYGEDI